MLATRRPRRGELLSGPVSTASDDPTVSLPLPGTPGRGLGRGARCAWSLVAFDPRIDGRSTRRTVSDVAGRSPLSPALSPEYREEGGWCSTFEVAAAFR